MPLKHSTSIFRGSVFSAIPVVGTSYIWIFARLLCSGTVIVLGCRSTWPHVLTAAPSPTFPRQSLLSSSQRSVPYTNQVASHLPPPPNLALHLRPFFRRLMGTQRCGTYMNFTTTRCTCSSLFRPPSIPLSLSLTPLSFPCESSLDNAIATIVQHPLPAVPPTVVFHLSAASDSQHTPERVVVSIRSCNFFVLALLVVDCERDARRLRLRLRV